MVIDLLTPSPWSNEIEVSSSIRSFLRANDPDDWITAINAIVHRYAVGLMPDDSNHRPTKMSEMLVIPIQ